MKKLLSFVCFAFVAMQSSFLLAQNNAFDFDGVNDYISVPNASSLIAPTTAMSLSCWVFPTNPAPAYPNFDGFLGFRNDFSADFYLLQLNTTNIEARFRNSSGTNFDVVQGGIVNNTWQHLVMTYDGSLLQVYLNGVPGGSTVATGSITSSAVEFVMGKLDFSATDFFLDGRLDEVGLWSKALSAAEVACMYERGIDPTDANLELYFDFNEGIAGGTNTAITTVPDRMGNIDGQIISAALSGASSNFVNGVATHTQIADSFCAGSSYSFAGQTLSAPGVYYELISTGGCDSIVALTLSETNAANGTDTRTECGSFTWINGVTYTSSNTTAKDTILNGASSGCDSIVSLNLTLLNGGSGTDVQVACDSFVWIDGNTYTSSNNTATDTLFGGASNNCDSIVTLDLTILNSSFGRDSITACESYTWLDGVTYTASNDTSTFTIANGASNGCDSTVFLDLVILNPTQGTDVQSACNSFTWIDGVTYTADNDTSTFTLVGGAANGCDSIVTLNLSITSIDTTVNQTLGIPSTLASAESGASYQWLDCDDGFSPIAGETNIDFTPLLVGSYAVEITKNGCVDTSACVDVLSVSIRNNNFSTEVQVYPNPNQGNFTVDLGESYTEVQLKLFNVSGQLIMEKSYDEVQVLPIDLDSQVAGVYILQIADKKQNVLNIRVMKE